MHGGTHRGSRFLRATAAHKQISNRFLVNEGPSLPVTPPAPRSEQPQRAAQWRADFRLGVVEVIALLRRPGLRQ